VNGVRLWGWESTQKSPKAGLHKKKRFRERYLPTGVPALRFLVWAVTITTRLWTSSEMFLFLFLIIYTVLLIEVVVLPESFLLTFKAALGV